MKLVKSLIFVISIIFTANVMVVKAKPVNENFDDDNFYKCVIDQYNEKNGKSISYDTSLTEEELLTIKSLVCSGKNKDKSELIMSVKGIEKLSNITLLDLNGNDLKTINLSSNTKLKQLYLDFNELTELDVSNNNELKYLSILSNKIEDLNLEKNIELEYLQARGNLIKNISFLNNSKLRTFNIMDNNLLSLDLFNNKNLSEDIYYSPQHREITVQFIDNKYVFDLKNLDTTIDLSKIVLNETETIKYNNETGLIEILELPEDKIISYEYDINNGFQKMSVDLIIISIEETNDNEENKTNLDKPIDNSSKGEDNTPTEKPSENEVDKPIPEEEIPPTGTISIVSFIIVGTIAEILFCLTKKKNKVHKI